MLDIPKIRADFPLLQRQVHGQPLVYFDNAATTQKPQCVIDALTQYYQQDNANIHRGVHYLSQCATDSYEAVRTQISSFINAQRREEIVFVRGTTEAINLVAQSFVRPKLQAGDEILISAMEHHSNIVPWQLLCQQTGAVLKVVPMDEQGNLCLEALEPLLSPRTKFCAIAHIANAIGTVNPIQSIIDRCHAHGVPVLIDGAQAVAHTAVDVQQLDCDFYAFSGHKLLGPTGIGVLYAKYALLDAMPPYQGGGDMIRTVSFEGTTFNAVPFKFEAGTPNIAGVIALGAAINYIQAIGLEAIAAYEQQLLDYATQRLGEIPGLRIIGTAREKASIVSFVMQVAHPHDIGTILDQHGVAIRAGHHCAMPLMTFFKVPATARLSFAFYNTCAEIDVAMTALAAVSRIFA